MDRTDYDAIRDEIVALCKLPLTLGKPEPEEGYMPRRNGSHDGQLVTLRYTTPGEIAGYRFKWTGPTDGVASHRMSAFGTKGMVSLGGDWYAKPKGSPMPKLGSVLASLLMDAQAGTLTFDEFCGDYGYDSDSRKAEACWRECQGALAAMVRAFGADLEKAQELANSL